MLWTLVVSYPVAQGLTIFLALHSRDFTYRVLLPGGALPHSSLTTPLGCRYSRTGYPPVMGSAWLR